MASLLLMVASAGDPPVQAVPDDQVAPDIVVRAVRGRCEIAYAGSRLDGRGQRKLADGWPADKPLRVQEPRGADRACLVRITFSLAKLGFNHVVFVDRPSPP